VISEKFAPRTLKTTELKLSSKTPNLKSRSISVERN
jgi:hypothetical protein